MTGLFGSIFDPPHNGHLALVRCAREHFGFDRLVVLVVADPGHKTVETEAGTRLALARLAFPAEEIELDPHPTTAAAIRATAATEIKSRFLIWYSSGDCGPIARPTNGSTDQWFRIFPVRQGIVC